MAAPNEAGPIRTVPFFFSFSFLIVIVKKMDANILLFIIQCFINFFVIFCNFIVICIFLY